MKVEINIEEIQEFLPHRYPMLLVDRVTELVLGESIKAYKNITTNEPFFTGHFPWKAGDAGSFNSGKYGTSFRNTWVQNNG